jgi:hypothetical protein
VGDATHLNGGPGSTSIFRSRVMRTYIERRRQAHEYAGYRRSKDELGRASMRASHFLAEW